MPLLHMSEPAHSVVENAACYEVVTPVPSQERPCSGTVTGMLRQFDLHLGAAIAPAAYVEAARVEIAVDKLFQGLTSPVPSLGNQYLLDPTPPPLTIAPSPPVSQLGGERYLTAGRHSWRLRTDSDLTLAGGNRTQLDQAPAMENWPCLTRRRKRCEDLSS